jgi:hypothetical protein
MLHGGRRLSYFLVSTSQNVYVNVHVVEEDCFSLSSSQNLYVNLHMVLHIGVVTLFVVLKLNMENMEGE